jgi:hypothetical protein
MRFTGSRWNRFLIAGWQGDSGHDVIDDSCTRFNEYRYAESNTPCRSTLI